MCDGVVHGEGRRVMDVEGVLCEVRFTSIPLFTDIFHRMVDRFLDHVYCCRSPYLFSTAHKVPTGAERVDTECMAIVVFLLRLVYRLDDTFEM